MAKTVIRIWGGLFSLPRALSPCRITYSDVFYLSVRILPALGIMNRRRFLQLLIASTASAAGGCHRQTNPATSIASTTDARQLFDSYFLTIYEGFLKNARDTSPSLAVCDFPAGTKLKTCCNPAGHTYTSVSRMLPAMAEWSLARNDRKVRDVLLSIYRTAFDPAHPEFWGLAPADRATQRSVEASLVAYTLFRLGPDFSAHLTSPQRTNIQTWLASCTQVPERTSNHAWFTALNHASRLELSRTFKEFTGDEKWMLDDLRALDSLYKENNEGWYSDSPDFPCYDYYNFWTFANFPLYWSQVIGHRYPDWNKKFRDRVATFLEKTPYFFAKNGAHPLMGRSLIYRFALLSPMVLGYQQNLWKHSPGMLRRIVRKSLEFHWKIGAFDEQNGKLRENYAAAGLPLREAYIDNGHPYWAMQAFSFFSIPKEDPFWTSPEEPLPVERHDFTLRFNGPRMLLVGSRSSGQIRWLCANNSPRRDTYRDKYIKFSYSSHFPFNTFSTTANCPADQTLVFHDPTTGKQYCRHRVINGQLTPDGIETKWEVQVAARTIQIVTRLRLVGEFELRTHTIVSPIAMNVSEGSYPLGIPAADEVQFARADNWHSMKCKTRPDLLMAWNLAGYRDLKPIEILDPATRATANIVYPRSAVLTLSAALEPGQTTLSSLHYASPRSLPLDEIQARAAPFVARVSNP